MIGPGHEHKNFVLELTYNYGTTVRAPKRDVSGSCTDWTGTYAVGVWMGRYQRLQIGQ
jgi:hypothetical protein